MDTPVRRRKENRTGQNKTEHHDGTICIQKCYCNEATENKETSDGHCTEKNRTEKNRTEQKRTEQKRTEQNTTCTF